MLWCQKPVFLRKVNQKFRSHSILYIYSNFSRY
nr:MAG TPA: hypothetical protein [Caudoviricetes sp.]